MKRSCAVYSEFLVLHVDLFLLLLLCILCSFPDSFYSACMSPENTHKLIRFYMEVYSAS